MNRILFCFFISTILFTATSCNKPDETAGLTIETLTDSTQLIPGDARSCKAQREGSTDSDITKKYFTVRGLKLTWGDRSADLYVTYIQIKFKSPLLSSGSLSCVISGDELKALYWSDPSDETTTWNGFIGRIGEGARASLTMNCDYSCGGIKVSQIGSLSGTIRAVGFKRDSAGEEQAVDATNNFSVVNSIIED